MASLIDKYKELLQPVGKKLSQAVVQNAPKAVKFAGNVAKGVSDQVGLTDYINTQKQGYQQIGKVFAPNQTFQQRQKQAADIAPLLPKLTQKSRNVAVKGSLFAAPGALPAAVVGGTIGGLGAKLQGQNVGQGVGQGLTAGVQSNAVSGLTNPFLSKLIPKNTSILTSRALPAALNTLQGIGVDKVTGQQTTPVSLGIDFGVGLLGGKSQFDASVKLPKTNIEPSQLKGIIPVQKTGLREIQPTADKPLGGMVGYAKSRLIKVDGIQARNPDGTYSFKAKIPQYIGNKVKNVSVQFKTDPTNPNRLLRVGGGLDNAYGVAAGIEPEYDENGKVTGVRVDPTKALAGLAVMGGVKAVGKINSPSSQIDSPDTRSYQNLDMDTVSKQGTPKVQPEIKTPSAILSETNSLIQSVKNKANELYTKTIDRFNPLYRLADDAGQDKAMRNAMTGYYGAASTSDYHVDFELAPILKSADPQDLRAAAIAQRDLELSGRDIQGSAKQTDAKKILSELEAKYGVEGYVNLQTTLKQLYQYQDGLVQKYLVNTGIISKEAYDSMRANNQFYVPFKRVMDTVDEQLGFVPQKQAGSVSSQNVIKGIKGSEREVIDPLQSIIENTYKIVGLGKRQEVARTIVSLKDYLPEGVIKEATGNVTGKSTISVFENGKAIKYLVPKEVSDAAKGMTEDQMGTIVRLLAAPTKVFRATATGLNPEFMLPNVVRDLQGAFVNVGLNPLRFVQGLSSLMKQDQTYQDFLRSGGKVSSVSLDQPFIKKRVGEITGEKGLIEVKPSRILTILQKLGEASEQPTRIATFKQVRDKLLKQGLSTEEAEKQAAYAAQEATVNFSRRGSETRTVNALYAFLNARAQGTDRLIRSLKADPKGAGIRMAMVTVAPAVALYAHNRNFDSYFDDRVVSQSDKNNNFIFMLSNQPIQQLGGAQFIKIPKGDIGKFANPIEQFMMYADKKGGDIAGSLWSTLKAFVPIDNAGDFAPTAVRPILEDRANRNFFTGMEIVPSYKKNLPPENQDSSYTAPLFRAIGDAANVSPARLQNLTEGYGTGFTKIAEMATKPLLPGYTSPQNLRGADVNQTPVVRRFLGGEKKSAEEAKEDSRNKLEQLQRDETTLRNKIRRGEVNEVEGNKRLQVIEQKIDKTRGYEQSLVPEKNKLVSQASASEQTMTAITKLDDYAKDDVRYSLKYGDQVEDSTLGSYFFGDAASLPSSNKYEKAVRDSKLFSRLATINDNENLSNEQRSSVKDLLAQEIGISRSDLDYYEVANDSDNLKTIYVMESIAGKSNPTDYLANGRKKVNGELLVSDGVIDNLVDEGIITKVQGKALKNIDYTDEGKLKVKSGTGKKIKVTTPEAPKIPVIKLSQPKRARLVRPATKQYKINKIRLKSKGIKKVKKLTLR